jgi:hypothetical protein
MMVADIQIHQAMVRTGSASDQEMFPKLNRDLPGDGLAHITRGNPTSIASQETLVIIENVQEARGSAKYIVSSEFSVSVLSYCN